MTTDRRRSTTADRPTPVSGAASCCSIGGLTVSLGALVAACGETGGGPSRAASATPPRRPRCRASRSTTPCYLRTATSIEYTIIDVYARSPTAARSTPSAPGAARPPRSRTTRPPSTTTVRADHRGRRRAVRVRQRLVHGPRRRSRSSTTSSATEDRTSRRATTRRATCSSSSTASSRWRRRRTSSIVETLTEPELRAEVMALGAQDGPPRGGGRDRRRPARPRATSARRCSARTASTPSRRAHAGLRHPVPVRLAGRRSRSPSARRATAARGSRSPRDAGRQLVHLRRA